MFPQVTCCWMESVRQRMTVMANCEFKESPDTNLCHSHTEPELHLST